MIGAIVGGSVSIVVGIICFVIGLQNNKGNISMLHSYHINNINEDETLIFGKKIGFGMIIIAISLIIYGVMFVVYELSKENIYFLISHTILTGGLILGASICLYTIKKYNRKIIG